MRRSTTTIVLSMLVLAALVLGACAPVPPVTSLSLAAAMPAAQPDGGAKDEAVMEVMAQFYEAYRTYDTDLLLSLHTDDAVWTWIDEGKNFPNFGPEGIWVGTGKDEIRAMFDFDRGAQGFSGYSVWMKVSGNNVTGHRGVGKRLHSCHRRPADHPIHVQSEPRQDHGMGLVPVGGEFLALHDHPGPPRGEQGTHDHHQRRDI
jgi:hypothetical protein